LKIKLFQSTLVGLCLSATGFSQSGGGVGVGGQTEGNAPKIWKVITSVAVPVLLHEYLVLLGPENPTLTLQGDDLIGLGVVDDLVFSRLEYCYGSTNSLPVWSLPFGTLFGSEPNLSIKEHTVLLYGSRPNTESELIAHFTEHATGALFPVPSGFIVTDAFETHGQFPDPNPSNAPAGATATRGLWRSNFITLSGTKVKLNSSRPAGTPITFGEWITLGQ
jgi:hypothetical protein